MVFYFEAGMNVTELKTEIKDHYRGIFRDAQQGSGLTEANDRILAVTVALAAIIPLTILFPVAAPFMTLKAGAISAGVLSACGIGSKKLTDVIIAHRAEKRMEKAFDSGDLIDRYIHDVLEADARTSRAALIDVKRLADQFHGKAEASLSPPDAALPKFSAPPSDSPATKTAPAAS